jgi:hypothetical protein
MRLFMMVALLANGPGVAAVSMHMQHLRASTGDPAHIASTQATAEAMAACHGATVLAPVTEDDHPQPQMGDQTGTAPQLDDCCETGNCHGCILHCFAAISGSARADFIVRYRQSDQPLLSVHTSAALTNLFRPPIG